GQGCDFAPSDAGMTATNGGDFGIESRVFRVGDRFTVEIAPSLRFEAVAAIDQHGFGRGVARGPENTLHQVGRARYWRFRLPGPRGGWGPWRRIESACTDMCVALCDGTHHLRDGFRSDEAQRNALLRGEPSQEVYVVTHERAVGIGKVEDRAGIDD